MGWFYWKLVLMKSYTDEWILLKTGVKLLIYLVFALSRDKSDRNVRISVFLF